MVSMDTIDLIHTPAVIQSPAPIVRAETLPVKTQRALCLAASRRVVMNDLSPTPAIATVAKAVVNPATIFKTLQKPYRKSLMPVVSVSTCGYGFSDLWVS